MDAIIYPYQKVDETNFIKVPTSKSLAHRSIISASLANGKSIISNVNLSDDIIATINAVKNLGANINIINNNLEIIGRSNKILDSLSFSCNESGSTLRFMIPICSLFSLNTKIYGTPKLLSRPLSIYQDIFKDNLKIYENYLEVKPCLKGNHYSILGNVSSQFITGLLFSLPLLPTSSSIEIIPPLESGSYLELTLDVLNKFGINIERKSQYLFYIPGMQQYKPCNYIVEGDYSQAAFFYVFGLFNQELTIQGLNNNSLQGDKAIEKILKQMNGRIDDLTHTVYPSKLKNVEISLEDCPDLGPILMVASAHANGQTTFYNIERLRLKESDRILSMQQELQKFNISFCVYPDKVIITGKDEIKTNEVIDCHNDHRICMAMAIMATISANPVKLTGVECINKSYPTFFTDLRKLGVKVELI